MWLRNLFVVLFASLAMSCSSPAPTQPAFTGTWVGPLPVDGGATRTFVVQVHERADLKVMAYMMGGTTRRSVLAGYRRGDRMTMIFYMPDRGLNRTITLSGAVAGDTLTGTATVDSVEHPVTWTRQPGPFVERNFIFATEDEGDNIAELSIVQDAAGALVSGNFTADACGFIACGAGVTSFAEAADGALTIGLATDGACNAPAGISAAFNAAERMYSGSWSRDAASGCAAASGTTFGGQAMGTTSADAAGVFAMLGQLGDDIQAGAAFTAPYGPVSDSYLHFGETQAALLGSLNAEVAAHPSADVEFVYFTTLRTIAPPALHPLLPATPIVLFGDIRRDSGGEYRSAAPDAAGEGRLRYIRQETGSWRLVGNQASEFDLPFAYSIGAERLLAPTGPGGETLSVSLGGWGAHFSPQTGHLEGNGKVDFMAQYVGSASELTELVNGTGGSPGVCDANLVWSGSGEVCGVFGGASGELIRARMLRYRAPYDGRVTRILYEERPRPASAPTTHYFDNVPHWSVSVEFEGGLSIEFGHLGQLIGAVRSGLIATRGIDPDTYSPPTSECPLSPARCHVDVLDGASFPISRHDEIAIAQTDAAPIPGHPGYYRGQIGPSIPPWSQVEFFMSERVGVRSAEVCVYLYLPEARRMAMAAAMTRDMLNPGSLRYAENDFVRPWKYRAEAELCNNDGYFYRNESDFSSIHSQLGGWYERPSPGVTANEQFTIARIHQGAGAYSPSLYTTLLGGSEPTEFLVGRQRTDRAAFAWPIVGGGAVNEWYPTGEVLQLTESSFVVKWREIGFTRPGITATRGELYQRAAYALDEEGLRIKWGPIAPSLGAAPTPTLTPGEACDDVVVLCYGHTRP